jgi:hypothetical protein
MCKLRPILRIFQHSIVFHILGVCCVSGLTVIFDKESFACWLKDRKQILLRLLNPHASVVTSSSLLMFKAEVNLLLFGIYFTHSPYQSHSLQQTRIEIRLTIGILVLAILFFSPFPFFLFGGFLGFLGFIATSSRFSISNLKKYLKIPLV